MMHICVKDESVHLNCTFDCYIQVGYGYEAFQSKPSSPSATFWPAYYLSWSPPQCTIKCRTLLEVAHFLLHEQERWEASRRLAGELLGLLRGVHTIVHQHHRVFSVNSSTICDNVSIILCSLAKHTCEELCHDLHCQQYNLVRCSSLLFTLTKVCKLPTYRA